MTKATTKSSKNSAATSNTANQVEVKPAPSANVFKITMTAVYKDTSIGANEISDELFHAMTKVGKGLSILHVDSVKKSSKPQEDIMKILKEVSEQTADSMSDETDDSGTQFVVVENAGKKRRK